MIKAAVSVRMTESRPPVGMPKPDVVRPECEALTPGIYKMAGVVGKEYYTLAEKPQAAPVQESAPAVELTQESLTKAWEMFVSKMKDSDAPEDNTLADLLKSVSPKLAMKEDKPYVQMQMSSAYVASELKKYMSKLMTFLRVETHCPQMLQEVEMVKEQRESIIYSPRDKYEYMLRQNPCLAEFKELFDSIDL